jgi:hypothetical protein
MLSDYVAECLSNVKGSRNLDHLTSLSDSAAESLSKIDMDSYDYLSLNGLASLSDAAAYSLCKLKGRLILDGLTGLSDYAAECLSNLREELSLDGLTSLSDAAVYSLCKFKGRLSLDGLTSSEIINGPKKPPLEPTPQELKEREQFSVSEDGRQFTPEINSAVTLSSQTPVVRKPKSKAPLADPSTSHAISPRERLRQALQEVMADGIITENEKLYIQNLRKSLGITNEEFQQIFTEVKSEISLKRKTTTKNASIKYPTKKISQTILLVNQKNQILIVFL